MSSNNNIVQNLEEIILTEYKSSIKIDFFPANCAHKDYWRYECNQRVQLSPEVSRESLLCYSVSAPTREEACNRLYNAIKKDKEASDEMKKQYEEMQKVKEKTNEMSI